MLYPVLHYGFFIVVGLIAAVCYGLTAKPSIASIVLAFSGFFFFPALLSSVRNKPEALALFAGLLGGYLAALGSRFMRRRSMRLAQAAHELSSLAGGAEPTVVREPIAHLPPYRHWEKRDGVEDTPGDLLQGDDTNDGLPMLVLGRPGQHTDRRI